LNCCALVRSPASTSQVGAGVGVGADVADTVGETTVVETTGVAAPEQLMVMKATATRAMARYTVDLIAPGAVCDPSCACSPR
jgi:hypothetical protein